MSRENPLDSQRPLNVIWRRQTLDNVLEGFFIREELLSGIDRPIRLLAFEEDSTFPFMDDVLIVNLFEENNHLIAETLNRGARNVGVLQMGDELGVMPRDYYPYVDYVLRHYYFPDCFDLPPDARSLGVTWVPNGYARGVGPSQPSRQLSFDQRHLLTFFSGYIYNPDRPLPERETMVKVVRQSDIPGKLVSTEGFAGGYGPSAFAALMGSVRFALCPAGNSAETIRLYDALENGAVPVVVDAPYLNAPDALDGAPVLRLEDWEDLPEALEPYRDGEESLIQGEALRSSLVSWWSGFKTDMAEKVGDVIGTAFQRTA